MTALAKIFAEEVALSLPVTAAEDEVTIKSKIKENARDYLRDGADVPDFNEDQMVREIQKELRRRKAAIPKSSELCPLVLGDARKGMKAR